MSHRWGSAEPAARQVRPGLDRREAPGGFSSSSIHLQNFDCPPAHVLARRSRWHRDALPGAPATFTEGMPRDEGHSDRRGDSARERARHSPNNGKQAAGICPSLLPALRL